jgi:CheY-like chemotaxis protein
MDVVDRWTDVDRGGHFAALEEPGTLVEDVREFFRPLRWDRRSSGLRGDPRTNANLQLKGPVLCSADPRRALVRSPSSGLGRMSDPRILVVDDDQVIQQLLKVNLELEGYAVEVASDGQEALALFANFEPDLVLLDIMMPKLDGWEVARRLAGATGGPVPIVLLSARAQESDMQKGTELGVAAYVTKPFDPIQLLHLVAGILAQQGRGAPTAGTP